jgi:predicted hydrocarbon binding protein
MDKFIYKIFLKVESKRILLLLSVSTFFSSTLPHVSKRFPDHEYIISPFWWVFFVFTVVVLSIKIFIDFKFKPLKLYLNPTTNILYDKDSHFENVALRRETVRLMLTAINKLDSTKVALFNLGQEIGNNFQWHLIKYCNIAMEDKSFAKLPPNEKIEKWLGYDSQTGMGKFKLLNYSSAPLKFDISLDNSFTAESNVELCEFLKGYITGNCSALFSPTKFDIETRDCGTGANKQCYFSITAK